MTCRCHYRSIATILAVAAMFHSGLPAAHGHLSIIRQGLESAGVMEAGDQYGAALASGDFNGDGYDDLAVGSPLEDVSTAGGSILNAGAVIVSYGLNTGIGTGTATVLTQDNLGYTSEAGDRFGWSLAVGNFNNDAYDDLAIGSPNESIDFNDNAGNVIIVYGGPSGLTSASASGIVSQGNSPGALEAGDAFGYAVSSGDYNGDGFDDLAVGIPGEDIEVGVNPIVDAGAIELYFGSAAGITTAGAYIITDDDTINAAQAGAAYGFSLASGNFNGNAHDDLIVGVPGKNTSGPANHGVVEVLYGSAAGIVTGGAQLLNASSFGDAPSTNAQFGFAVAAGHATNDNFDDVAVGAPFRDLGSTQDVGRVYVAYGSNAGVDSSTGFHFGTVASSANMNIGYALAFGDWSDNGYDDLAVGIPGNSLAGGTGAGSVNIHAARNDGSGINPFNPSSETQAKLNEVPEANDRLGQAVCFGAFAGGTRKGLAVGAPLEDYEPFPGESAPSLTDAGSVCIDMPWLQVQFLSTRCAILTNCTNDIVFSQKPFERHLTASTTKIMTALLAVEATQPGCNPCAVNGLNSVYTVPAVLCDPQNQVGGLIGGSDAGLCSGETITLDELIQGALYPSGNDACFSIADLLYAPGTICGGNTPATCQDVFDFVDRMNERAAELGMFRTNFDNPSGAAHGSAWASNNFASPNDLARLSFFAMQNPLFRQYASAPGGSIIRNNSSCFPNNTVSNFCTGAFPVAGCNGPDFPNGSGIKPGSTPPAGRTFVAAVDHPDGRFFSVAMGSPGGTQIATDINNMLTLGANVFCVGPFVPQPPPPGSTLTAPSQPAGAGQASHFFIPLTFDPDRAVNVAALLSNGTDSAEIEIVIKRDIQVLLGPGENTTVDVAPFQRHDGLMLTNLGETPVDILLSFNQPILNATIHLVPGASFELPPHTASAPQTDATLSLTNLTSTADAILAIVELGYHYDTLLTSSRPAFNARMTADRLNGEDAVDVIVLGQDENPAASIDLILSNTLDADPGCDGFLSFDDIQPFVTALLDRDAYATTYPECFLFSADRNGDGKLDGLDVKVFTAELLDAT